MKEMPLEYFFEHYGPDFLKKLPKYSTAKLGDQYVLLLAFDAERMEYWIKQANGDTVLCSVLALDEFVL